MAAGRRACIGHGRVWISHRTEDRRRSQRLTRTEFFLRSGPLRCQHAALDSAPAQPWGLRARPRRGRPCPEHSKAFPRTRRSRPARGPNDSARTASLGGGEWWVKRYRVTRDRGASWGTGLSVLKSRFGANRDSWSASRWPTSDPPIGNADSRTRNAVGRALGPVL